MKDLFLGIFIATIGFAISRLIKKKEQPEQKQIEAPEQKQVEPPEQEGADYSKAYQARYLLTKNEWSEYKKLKELAAGEGLQICPKVRLLDIIEPRKDQPNYKTLLYKVQSKHVDFVITDQNLHIKAIIELDDGSHDTEKRQKRDKFLDQILTSCGYKVIRTRSITENILENL